MATTDEIRARLTRVLVQALGVAEDEVTPDATLLGDLGAESIDLLDITFRLEREFVIQVPRGELFLEPLFQGDSGAVQHGRWTEDGIAALREQMPYADPGDTGRDGWPGLVTDLFTVDLLVRYIAWKLEGRAAGVAACAARG
jgi:acyl carrier protein